jgi:four helix bundle protein
MDDRIRSFRDLEAWQLGMDLVDLVLAHLKEMPEREWDLKRQMSRAAISIPSNVAEGWRRKKRRGAYQNHVSIAMGSQGELETEIEVCSTILWTNPARFSRPGGAFVSRRGFGLPPGEVLVCLPAGFCSVSRRLSIPPPGRFFSPYGPFAQNLRF